MMDTRGVRRPGPVVGLTKTEALAASGLSALEALLMHTWFS
jgi:hypothetical protein